MLQPVVYPLLSEIHQALGPLTSPDSNYSLFKEPVTVNLEKAGESLF